MIIGVEQNTTLADIILTFTIYICLNNELRIHPETLGFRNNGNIILLIFNSGIKQKLMQLTSFKK